MTRAWIALVCLALAGCATSGPPGVGSAGTPLETWTERELVPYLAEELTTHPRFRGEAVRLGVADGDRVGASIDGLSVALRDRLHQRLIETPGVRLSWQPSGTPWEHPGSRGDFRCHDDPAAYLVAIDVSPLDARRHRVEVRALDLAERSWVPGFGLRWEGTLSHREAASATRRHVDEHARGLRELPFGPEELDLLAAYLAHNLACLLEAHGAEDLLVHPASGAADPTADRVVALVAHYLASRERVRVSDVAAPASVVLRGRLEPVRNDLHQFWIMLRPRAARSDLPALDAEAYLLLLGTAAVANPPPPDDPGPAIRTLELIRPKRSRACARSDPWARGFWSSADPEIAGGECFGLRLELDRPTRLVFLRQDQDARLCALTGAVQRPPGETHWPAERALVWSGGPGLQTYYAVVVPDSEGPRLGAVVARAACEIGDLEGSALREWLADLRVAGERSAGDSEWRAVRVYQAAEE